DRRRAVIDIVGEADRDDAAGLQGFAGDLGIGEKPFMLDRVAVGRLVEQAFEIGENQIGGAQGLADPRERRAGLRDIHQIDVADQDQGRHLEILLLRTYICYYYEWISNGTKQSAGPISSSMASILSMRSRCSPAASS